MQRYLLRYITMQTAQATEVIMVETLNSYYGLSNIIICIPIRVYIYDFIVYISTVEYYVRYFFIKFRSLIGSQLYFLSFY